MYVKRSKKRTYKKRNSVKTVKKSSMPSKILTKTLKGLIDKRIRKKAELKSIPINEEEYVFTSTNADLSNPVNLTRFFEISNGTGDGQRIGNIINVEKANLKLIVRKNLSASNQYPAVVYIWIGYLKADRNTDPSAYFPSFYNDGPSVLPWNGTMQRTLREENKDLFTIYKKFRFKLGSSTSANSGFNNNDFGIFYNTTVSLKPILGKLQFQDDGTAGAVNRDLFMWASYCNIDDVIDNIAVTPGLRPVDILYWVDGKYTDS